MSSCIDGYTTCVLRKEFAFDEVYSPTVPHWIPCVPLYHFNCAESFGNSLLTPLQWVLIELEEPHNLFVDAALRIAFLFALVVSAPGMFFKKFGELFNPHSALREQAIAKLEEIRVMKINFSNTVIKMANIPYLKAEDTADLDSFFEEKILAKKTDPKEREAFQAQWKAAVSSFADALKAEKDPSPSEKEIHRLLGDDKEALAKFAKFTDFAKKAFEYTFGTYNALVDCHEACLQYNQILAHVSPTYTPA